jgi:aspartate-semialdehyde dehydrogenase
MRKIPTAVLGCTGLVGQQFIRLLIHNPYFEITALTASAKAKGKNYCDVVDQTQDISFPSSIHDQKLMETSVDVVIRSGAKVVFSALPAHIAEVIEKPLASKGIFVFSNARTNRMEPDVPIMIPEVNPDHLQVVARSVSEKKGFIITNSNCTATGLVIALKPLMDFGIKSVITSTYQAISGAGRKGLSAFEITGNVIPFIESEEEKVEGETAKIFGKWINGCLKPANIEVNASCCRVPVLDGHLATVTVELKREIDLDILKESIHSFRGIPQDLTLPTAPDIPIIVREEKNRPQPVLDVNAGSPDRAKGMAISLGRLRKKGRRINFVLLVHNTIRGAAGTCILNAEYAHSQGLLKNSARDIYSERRTT